MSDEAEKDKKAPKSRFVMSLEEFKSSLYTLEEALAWKAKRTAEIEAAIARMRQEAAEERAR